MALMKQMHLFVHSMCLVSTHEALGVLCIPDTDGHLLDLGTEGLLWCEHQQLGQ